MLLLISTASYSEPNPRDVALAMPTLKLVLLENPAAVGTMNHLRMEVETPSEVADAIDRLQRSDLETKIESQTTCCYAVQDKVWVHDPDGAAREVYTVLADARVRDQKPVSTGICCQPG